jgi:hypothetical protein
MNKFIRLLTEDPRLSRWCDRSSRIVPKAGCTACLLYSKARRAKARQGKLVVESAGGRKKSVSAFGVHAVELRAEKEDIRSIGNVSVLGEPPHSPLNLFISKKFSEDCGGSPSVEMVANGQTHHINLSRQTGDGLRFH